MLLLLPPSETKRSGGPEGARLEVRDLRYPALNRLRRATLRAVRELARDPEATITALGLGPTRSDAVRANRRVTISPVLPAVDRFTGVLYDALDAGSLDDRARSWLDEQVVIGTALLGPIGALDAIPDHRLSHDSRLPGFGLRAEWAAAAGRALGEGMRDVGVVLDARSEGYVRLAPLPPIRSGAEVAFLRVVTDEGGRRRALNHDNKQAKGRLARALATAGETPRSIAELIRSAADLGFRLERSSRRVGEGDSAVLDLVVYPPTRRPGSDPAPR